MSKSSKERLVASTLLAGMASFGVPLALGTVALTAPAAAQDVADEEEEAIVVTGTILRGNANSVSPLGTVTSEDMEVRGQTTVADVLQTLSGNAGGSLPNSFTANGAFAGGASTVSLRGLLTSNTLVLVDGLRPAYYPLADDGTRNFVDVNTIPQAVVERVDVLKDGASSTYGADAIAGVINIITRREYEGIQFDLSQGWSEQGGAEREHFSAMWGHGDLGSDGFNAYVAVEYQHDAMLRNRERGFPFNTADQTSWCETSLAPAYLGADTCVTNGILWGIQPEDNSLLAIGQTTHAVVRAADATNTVLAGDWQLLNPDCGDLTPAVITPAQAANGGFTGFAAPVNVCQQDLVHDYGVITPENTRLGVTGRITFRVNDRNEFYAMGSYYQNDVFTQNANQSFRQIATPAATGISVNTLNINLPIYVCGAGQWNYTCDGTEGDAVLNPNNPFALGGEVARLRGRIQDVDNDTRQFAQAFRAAAGFSGDWDMMGSEYQYAFDVTGMQSNLHKVSHGNLFYTGLLAAVNQGTYNFINPELNTQAVRDLVAPESVQESSSKMIQAQLSISTDLFELPGGTAQGGIMLQARYEALNNPSENPDTNGPEQRYLTINPFGASGSRDTESVAIELQMPVFETVDVNLSARYDTYSTGQSNLSPKLGIRFRPFDFLTFRGTYSTGFRIPSFAESFAEPTTGFIVDNAPAAWCTANHGGPAAAYCTGYGLGLTQIASANLDPEESENINLGFVVDLFDHWTFSADWYQIEIENTIAAGDFTPAYDAYYAGDPIPAGFFVTPGAPDPAFPLAPANIGFIGYSLGNQGQKHADGVDLQLNGNYDLGGIEWSTTVEGTYLRSLSQTLDGVEQEYAGSIGPYVITAASGTPQWRATWQNTFTMGPATLGITAYYTEGYGSGAEDVGGDADDCDTPPVTHYYDGETPVTCEVDPSFYVDLYGAYDFTDQWQVYLNIQNVADEAPALDTTTYGAFNYNPAWGTPGILGRYFILGVRANF